LAGLDDSFAFFFLLYLRCAFCFPAALGAALLLLGDAVLPLGDAVLLLGAAVFAGWALALATASFLFMQVVK